MHRQAIGIDIGGSSIKAAVVDLSRGCLVGERHSVPSPAMSAVSEMLHAMAEAVPPDTAHLPAGVTFPGVVVAGTVHTAANVAKSWIGQPLAEPAAQKLKREVVAINDADAAGLAEVHFGAARGVAGTVMVLSLGTGIGSALFVDGHLVPNTELGHLELHGHDAEKRASVKAREDEDLSWEHWAHRLKKYLAHVEMLFSPGLFVIGGGVSRKAEKFLPLIQGISAEIVPAELQNSAGIVGAAMAAAEL